MLNIWIHIFRSTFLSIRNPQGVRSDYIEAAHGLLVHSDMSDLNLTKPEHAVM